MSPSTPVQRRDFGSTGFTVPLLGLGLVKIGRNTGIKYPEGDGFALPTDSAVDELLRTSLDLGVNLWDTAPAYGSSETRIGQWVSKNREQRRRVLIFSKVGERFEAATARSEYDFSSSAMRASLEATLRALGVSELDGLALHFPRADLEVLKNTPALQTLAEFKKEGKVRAIGASTTSVEGGLYALPQVDYVMVSANLDYLAEWSVVEAAARSNKGVLIKRALLSGHVGSGSGGGTERATPEDCLRFFADKPEVSSVVVGTSRASNLSHHVAYFERFQAT